MPRKSTDGNELSVILDLAAGTRLTYDDMARVLGMSPRKFSDRRRMDDYPNAQECWLAAEYFNINPVYLLATFGLLTREDIEQYVASDHFVPGRRVRVMKAIPTILTTGGRRPEPMSDENDQHVRIRDYGPHPARKL